MKPLLLLKIMFFYYSVPEIPYSSPACNFQAIINFGDSNSDTGGLSATFGPTPPPYGETFFHMPAGRYSDGRLIIDFIAKSFGHPFLSSYLDSLGTNYSHGVNLATASSTIIDQNISLSQGGYSPFFLAIQVKQFSQFIPRSQLVAKQGRFFESLMPKKEYFNQSLYTIDIGQNDITAGLDAGKTYDEFIPQTLSAFSGDVKSMYALGARYFWIHNTGPLGCLAYVLLRRNITAAGELDSAGCAVFYNKAAQQFNKKLKETLVEMRKELPLAVITYVDIYSAKYSLFLEPAKYDLWKYKGKRKEPSRMAKPLGPTGEFFKRRDEWRKHPMLVNQFRYATPGLGIALIAFGVYLVGEAVYNRVNSSDPHASH